MCKWKWECKWGFSWSVKGGIDLEKVVLIFGESERGLRFLKRDKRALGELKKCVWSWSFWSGSDRRKVKKCTRTSKSWSWKISTLKVLSWSQKAPDLEKLMWSWKGKASILKSYGCFRKCASRSRKSSSEIIKKRHQSWSAPWSLKKHPPKLKKSKSSIFVIAPLKYSKDRWFDHIHQTTKNHLQLHYLLIYHSNKYSKSGFLLSDPLKPSHPPPHNHQ